MKTLFLVAVFVVGMSITLSAEILAYKYKVTGTEYEENDPNYDQVEKEKESGYYIVDTDSMDQCQIVEIDKKRGGVCSIWTLESITEMNFTTDKGNHILLRRLQVDGSDYEMLFQVGGKTKETLGEKIGSVANASQTFNIAKKMSGVSIAQEAGSRYSARKMTLTLDSKVTVHANSESYTVEDTVNYLKQVHGSSL